MKFSGPWNALVVVRLGRGLSSTIPDKGVAATCASLLLPDVQSLETRQGPPIRAAIASRFDGGRAKQAIQAVAASISATPR